MVVLSNRDEHSLFFVCLFVCLFCFSTVIAALDELKKYNSGAREAIKYLEAEFKRGNR